MSGQKKNKKGVALEQQVSPVAIMTNEVVSSPFHRRKWYTDQQLSTLIATIKKEGAEHAIRVRSLSEGSYEIITGECFWRAALKAGLTMIPAIIEQLDDSTVQELQLQEILQQTEPHPFDASYALQQLVMRKNMSVLDISFQINRTRAYVINRLCLADLHPCFHELFYTDVLSMGEALQLATLSGVSQQAVFEKHFNGCSDGSFNIDDIRELVGLYQDNLLYAVFDLNDATLLPEAGACNSCEFNTPIVHSMFPGKANGQCCEKPACYRKKDLAYFKRFIGNALLKDSITAVIHHATPTRRISEALYQSKLLMQLPFYHELNVMITHVPIMPTPEILMDSWDGDEEWTAEGMANDMEIAMEDYRRDKKDFDRALRKGQLLPALYIDHDRMEVLFFTPRPGGKTNSPDKPGWYTTYTSQ